MNPAKITVPTRVKRDMIMEAYTKIALSILPTSESHIQWMRSYIQNSMTEKDVAREWDFIRSGKVAALVKMLHTLNHGADTLVGREEIIDKLAGLHDTISEGLDHYKSSNEEIDDDTYKYLEDTLMGYVEEFERSMLSLPIMKNKPQLSESWVATARNVVNQSEIDEFLKSLIERNPEVTKWIKSNLRNYILNSLSAEKYNKKPTKSDPEWLHKAYQSGVDLWEVRIDRSFTDEIHHAIDWIIAQNFKDTTKVSVDEAIKQSKEWVDKLESKGGKDTPADSEVVHKFDDGFVIKRIKSSDGLVREGSKMQHCLKDPGMGWDKKVKSSGLIILSLRDKNDEPHCTMEITKSGEVHQIKGKQNKALAPKYHKYVQDFLKLHGGL